LGLFRYRTADTRFADQARAGRNWTVQKLSSEIGWRITDDGSRCTFGATIAETLAKPNVAMTYPFVIWKWPVDPAGKRRII
jgi:hypothetical protein